MRSAKNWLPLALCCGLFAILCCLVMGYPGVENDEALFANSLYAPYDYGPRDFSIGIFHQKVPLMLMSYLGTFKTLLYLPVFRIFPPSVVSLRLPPVIAGVATIWIFYLLVSKIGGRRAAVIAAVLLSTDVSYILTNTFDWGPVALQHLLLVSAILALLNFHQTSRNLLLGLGFFLLGLALWDKALFLWSLSGLGVATVIVFPREVIRRLSVRTVAVAAAGIVLGSVPLIIYNFRSHGGTLGQNASLSASIIPEKVPSLRNTFDGSGMMGYLTVDSFTGTPRGPANAGERFSVWLREKLGAQRKGYNEPLFLFTLLLLPFLWITPARRPMLFSLIFLIVAWTQMAMTKGAGASVHHVVLLWPVPFLFMAVALAQASKWLGRFGLAAVTLVTMVVAARNLVVYNEYRAELIEYGANSVWTDAIFALKNRMTAAYGSKHLFITDWGPMNSLRMLGHGSLKLYNDSFDASAPVAEDFKAMVVASLGDPEGVFISSVTGHETFPGVNARISEWAHEAGFEAVPLETIHDTNGRAIYQIFSFRKRDLISRSSGSVQSGVSGRSYPQ